MFKPIANGTCAVLEAYKRELAERYIASSKNSLPLGQDIIMLYVSW